MSTAVPNPSHSASPETNSAFPRSCSVLVLVWHKNQDQETDNVKQAECTPINRISFPSGILAATPKKQDETYQAQEVANDGPSQRPGSNRNITYRENEPTDTYTDVGVALVFLEQENLPLTRPI
jgi:hypothetical protein